MYVEMFEENFWVLEEMKQVRQFKRKIELLPSGKELAMYEILSIL